MEAHSLRPAIPRGIVLQVYKCSIIFGGATSGSAVVTEESEMAPMPIFISEAVFSRAIFGSSIVVRT